MPSFRANCVSLEDVEDYWLVGFADKAQETEKYLLLQRAFKDDAQDQSLEMATYYIEHNDQSCSCYGGIAYCDLHAKEIAFTFDNKGLSHLGISEPLHVTFDLDNGTFAKLRSRLKSVFSGTGCLRDHTA